MTWVLVSSALEAHDRERHEVAHVDKRRIAKKMEMASSFLAIVDAR